MARRRGGQNGGASLDSLLDTMTNVVGILVILLVVTQLGVGDAVDRITTGVRVSDAEIASAKASAEQIKQQREQLEMQLNDLQLADPKDRVQELDQQIQIAQSEIEHLLQQKQKAEAANRKQVEEAQKLLEQFRQQEQQLRQQILAANDHLAELRALLDKTPPRKVLPAKVVYLPNPRPAPEGAQPLYFLCREGKIYYWDRANLLDRARKKAEYLVVRRRLARDPSKGIDPEKLIPLFNKERINDSNFVLKLKANGRQPRVVFERKPNAGETMKDLENPRSIYRRGLRGVDPRKYYLRFTVWPDSFEVYLAARRIATELGIAAGWDATGTPNEIDVPLGGKIVFGPPPKPTKPSKPAPPKPEPQRPVPVDTID